MASSTNIPTDVRNTIEQWLQGNYDAATKTAIQQLLDQGQEAELMDAFYKSLEFGTGGMRGLRGVGTNRMNRYTVGMAVQGLANCLLRAFEGQTIKVAITYDNRIHSDVFAQVAADILSANGIEVYLSEALRPTPWLSFAIRHLGCQSGLMLTASHNPKEYNGLKVYWEDGAQIVAPHDAEIVAEVSKMDVSQVKFEGNPALVHHIGQAVDEAFISESLKRSVAPATTKSYSANVRIVFTPLHGTAGTILPQTLAAAGFSKVYTVAEQATVDGNFTHAPAPNPEDAEALELALVLAQQKDADLVLATDPDADRVGIAIPKPDGQWELLNGNQTGALITRFVLEQLQAQGKLPQNAFIVKTIVTTALISDIAKAHEVACYEALTGFKYIAKIIRELEGKQHFVAGGEESYGFMIGDFVRDKDAITTSLILAEMCAYLRAQGQSLYTYLLDTYQKYGFYLEGLHSLTKKGKSGAEEIQTLMQRLRQNPPTSLGGSPVKEVLDYQALTRHLLADGTQTPLVFERSNVLQFLTEAGDTISARPSGTEPKIKFYVSVRTELPSQADYEHKKADLEQKIRQMIVELGV
ncbi:phospho-sugar mutase [Eisenibacter elegans]|jgi:phosphoglucomutase|uniref:phospho-sugar mutase n=1 Tax=Eisenibacter elegans TaxID=997 RepID=UPI0004279138|nr:phospho-sugar mutase [Eisenibacter elegans]